MPKRGPYRKAGPRPAPPQWRHIYLAQWRALRGMTQEGLAEASGVSAGMISSLEAAKAGYSAESLHKLAKALRVEPGMIISVNPEHDPDLWSLMSDATPKEREQIAKVAGAIVTRKTGTKR